MENVSDKTLVTALSRLFAASNMAAVGKHDWEAQVRPGRDLEEAGFDISQTAMQNLAGCGGDLDGYDYPENMFEGERKAWQVDVTEAIAEGRLSELISDDIGELMVGKLTVKEVAKKVDAAK